MQRAHRILPGAGKGAPEAAGRRDGTGCAGKKTARGSAFFEPEASQRVGREGANIRESDMVSQTQIHTIARQMIEQHGFEAIAQAAQNAQACEGKGDAEEAREWRHIEDAMKIMRGPHVS